MIDLRLGCTFFMSIVLNDDAMYKECLTYASELEYLFQQVATFQADRQAAHSARLPLVEVEVTLHAGQAEEGAGLRPRPARGCTEGRIKRVSVNAIVIGIVEGGSESQHCIECLSPP